MVACDGRVQCNPGRDGNSALALGVVMKFTKEVHEIQVLHSGTVGTGWVRDLDVAAVAAVGAVLICSAALG